MCVVPFRPLWSSSLFLILAVRATLGTFLFIICLKIKENPPHCQISKQCPSLGVTCEMLTNIRCRFWWTVWFLMLLLLFISVMNSLGQGSCRQATGDSASVPICSCRMMIIICVQGYSENFWIWDNVGEVLRMLWSTWVSLSHLWKVIELYKIQKLIQNQSL